MDEKDNKQPENEKTEAEEKAEVQRHEQAELEGDAEARIEALAAEVAKLKEENAALKDKWLRALAELDNLRKRAEREVADARKYAIERFAAALLDVVDNLERALAAEGDVDTIREGVRLTLESWKRVMESFGMERIDAVGQPFDPMHHEALMELESDAHPRGIVIEQHAAGYKLAGRLLRPAKVIVSKGSAQDAPKEEQGSEA